MDNNQLPNARLELDFTVDALVYSDGDLRFVATEGDFKGVDLLTQLYWQMSAEVKPASVNQRRRYHVSAMVGEKHGREYIADYFEYDEVAVAMTGVA